MAKVAGVDGCPAGWLAIQRDSLTGEMQPLVASDAADLFDRTVSCDVVAIDIPIGVPSAGARLCDEQARRLLRAPRAGSVFPCPVRPALHARSYGEAATVSVAAHGRSLSKQAFAILGRIRDIDDELRARPEWSSRLREVHPELCFYFWNGERSMRHSKRTKAGAAERHRLVLSYFGPVFDAIRQQVPARWAADDDMLDALAALWSAERVAANVAVRVPTSVQRDALGLSMEMVA
jgi:predicted RNase H-like nuclease